MNLNFFVTNLIIFFDTIKAVELLNIKEKYKRFLIKSDKQDKKGKF